LFTAKKNFFFAILACSAHSLSPCLLISWLFEKRASMNPLLYWRRSSGIKTNI